MAAPVAGGFLRQALVAAALGASYILISTAMIFFNKHLLREDLFPFPTVLALSHQVTSGLCALALLRVQPSLFPSLAVVFPGGESSSRGMVESIAVALRCLLPFIAIAFGFAVSLVLGNYAYTIAPVSFLQMIKEAQITCIYPLSVLAGLESFKLRNFLCVGLIAICGSIAIGASPSLSLLGLAAGGVGCFGGAVQQVLTQKVMMCYGKAKVDPLTLVLCSAPAAFFWLLAPTVLLWSAAVPTRAWHCAGLLLANNCLAFALQVTMALTIATLSAVGLACCSILKDILIVLLGGLLLGEPLGRVQILGFFGTTTSIFVYSMLKLLPEWFEGAGRKSQ
mmetsp:Transcript_46315/g.110238  ORF Transcript_46315/g.110238 Transcript_46315/m.110238 type:complete len:337 (-) Transcript_46315:214-1224(-)